MYIGKEQFYKKSGDDIEKWWIRTKWTDQKKIKGKRVALRFTEKYLESLQRIREEKVDIVIPSHARHFPGDYFALAAKNDGMGKVLMISNAWQNLLDDRIRQIKEIIAHDN